MNSDPCKPSAGEWFEGLPDEVNKAVDDAIEKARMRSTNTLVNAAIDA